MLGNAEWLGAITALRVGWPVTAAVMAVTCTCHVLCNPRSAWQSLVLTVVSRVSAGLLTAAALTGIALANLASPAGMGEADGMLALYAGLGGSAQALVWSVEALDPEWGNRWLWSLLTTAICAEALGAIQWAWLPWSGCEPGTVTAVLVHAAARLVKQRRRVRLTATLLAAALVFRIAAGPQQAAYFARLTAGEVVGVSACAAAMAIHTPRVGHSRSGAAVDSSRWQVSAAHLRPLGVLGCCGTGAALAGVLGPRWTATLLAATIILLTWCFGFVTTGRG